MRKLIFTAIFILVIAVNVFAIEGEYKITEGKSPEGESYSGTVVITPKGDAFMLNWLLAKTGEQYRGVGILKDNILSVAWGAGNSSGVVSYKVEGKKLIGTWAMLPTGKFGKETLEKQG